MNEEAVQELADGLSKWKAADAWTALQDLIVRYTAALEDFDGKVSATRRLDEETKIHRL